MTLLCRFINITLFMTPHNIVLVYITRTYKVKYKNIFNFFKLLNNELLCLFSRNTFFSGSTFCLNYFCQDCIRYVQQGNNYSFNTELYSFSCGLDTSLLRTIQNITPLYWRIVHNPHLSDCG